MAIDWNRQDWGGHVTYASNGSWLEDESKEDE